MLSLHLKKTKRSKEARLSFPCFFSAPLKMSETIYDSFEKMAKKQNKEQVPPPAETENKKPSASKPPKKPQPSSPVSHATRKTLEESFKTVSNAHTSLLSHLDSL